MTESIHLAYHNSLVKIDIDFCTYHIYLQDYQGNNRMVVNASTDEVEQVNHYYPYGGLIGDLCIGQSEQEFKFGDKKLDRTYGLDLYDFEARQYDAIAPWFTSIDPLAEKYYSISPYAYCAGDPVNLVDPTGEFIQIAIQSSDSTVYYKWNQDQQAFMDGSGNVYEGDNSFVADLTQQLKTLNEASTGKSLLDFLTAHKDGVEVREGSNGETGYNQRGCKSIVYYSGGTNVLNGTAYTSLGHEFAHAKDRLRGTLDLGTWFVAQKEDGTNKVITNADKYAVFMENLIRSEHNLPIRESYIQTKNGPVAPFVVDLNGKNLFFNWTPTIKLGK